eukprot:538491_1
MESVVSFYCFVLVSIPFRIIAALIQFVVFIVIGISLSIVCCYHYCFAKWKKEGYYIEDSMWDIVEMNIPLLTSIVWYVGKFIHTYDTSRNKIETDVRIDNPKDLEDWSVRWIKRENLHSKKDIARFEEPRKNNTPFIIPNCGSIFRGFGKVILHG